MLINLNHLLDDLEDGDDPKKVILKMIENTEENEEIRVIANKRLLNYLLTNV